MPNAREAARLREIFWLHLDLISMLPVVDELKRRGWKNKENRTFKDEVRGGQPFNKCSLHAGVEPDAEARPLYRTERPGFVVRINFLLQGLPPSDRAFKLQGIVYRLRNE